MYDIYRLLCSLTNKTDFAPLKGCSAGLLNDMSKVAKVYLH
jgi:hypothetical protein